MIKLYKYQQDYLRDMPARHIMAADTGTGKTYMALDHYAKHGSGPLLILAPAAKVRTGDWEREIDEYFDRPDMMKPEYEIYSYERFSRNPSAAQFREGKRAIWRKFYTGSGGIQPSIIMDECHKIKNPSSNIGKATYFIGRDAKFLIGLSASPMPNGWIDFANYSKIWGFTKGITDFKKKYCVYDTYKGFPELKGYLNQKELAAQWQSISKPLSKDEALDLPPTTFIGVNFDKPSLYTKTFRTRLDEQGEMLDSAPKLTHALRQTLTQPKLPYLSELLEGTTENIVIFYNYVTEREAILDLIEKDHPDKTVYRQDGEKHQLPSKPTWDQVKNSVTVAQYRSGSTAVEMTYATQVVYFSPTYSYADYFQSIGRVHRNGQTEKTTFYNYRTVGTIEEDVYTVLRSKKDFQVKQWYKEKIDD